MMMDEGRLDFLLKQSADFWQHDYTSARGAAPPPPPAPSTTKKPKKSKKKKKKLKKKTSTPPISNSTEIVEMQESVNRLRSQRMMIERIKRDADSKEQKIVELEGFVENLRSQVSETAFESLQRERQLRAKLLQAEEVAHVNRETEAAMTAELKKLLNKAQQTDNELRCNLARTQAELEEFRTAVGDEIRSLQETNKNLEDEKLLLEERVEDLKSSLDVRTREVRRLEMKQLEFNNGQSQRVSELEKLRASDKTQLQELKDRNKSLTFLTRKQKDQLDAFAASLREAEKREYLLHGTIKELEENAKLLREQVDSDERGDMTLRQKLSETSKRLVESERINDDLRQAILKLQMDHQCRAQETSKYKVQYSDYEDKLQKASVHRKRMEVQLKNMSTQLQQLQRQLVQEMATTATLSRKLDEEKNSRTKVSKQRLQILTQFYDEEHKLKEALDHPRFHYNEDYQDQSSSSSSDCSISSISSADSTETFENTKIHQDTVQREVKVAQREFEANATKEKPVQHPSSGPPSTAFKTTASSRAKAIKKQKRKHRRKNKLHL